MSKKYTIRDIARQAGVSVATVSYVINHRDDQRISEETKRKVWQIINLLDYRPNTSAKSLATSRTCNVALYLAHEESLYKRCEQMIVAEELAAVLNAHGYRLLLQPKGDVAQVDYADAILCYDTNADFFRAVGEKNLIPLIAVDSLITSSLDIFFQVCTDYTALRGRADAHFGEGNYTYLCLAPNSEDIRALILKTLPSVHFVSETNGCVGNHGLTSRLPKEPDFPSGNIVYSQQSLSGLAGEKAFFAACPLQEKLEIVFSCMELAINRVPDCRHNVFV
ncbi:MAG: LacI family transcriptional regulator [Firmicutes bacterium]|nr:LacI family transcriptional regulator [Bacillota bacterium]